MRKIIQNLIITGYIIITISLLWDFFYIFDIFSHFYLQYFVIAIVLLLFSIYLKDKILILLCLIVLIFTWSSLYTAKIKLWDFNWNTDIYYLNANYFIDSPENIIKDIKKHNPKYLAMVEINENLHNEIMKFFNYSEHLYLKEDASSIWFYTNEKIISKKIHNLTYPIWEIKVKDLSIYLIHPLPPLSSELYHAQKENFKEVKNIFIKDTYKNKMILWDFNSSFYSSVFKKYFWELYYSPIYSWWVNSILRIPIDYAIWNHNFYNIYWSNLQASDHIPLIIDLK